MAALARNEGRDLIKVIHKGIGIPVEHLQAINPYPPDGAIDVNINVDLSWTPGSHATSHDVYFGTNSSPPFVCNQTAAIFDPGTMYYYTTYFWRIDEVNKWGATTGQIWTFTTVELPFDPFRASATAMRQSKDYGM
jgi:hypothetical protein